MTNENPYVGDNPAELRMRLSIFAFVDILGYQALTISATQRGPEAQQALLSRLHTALSQARLNLDDSMSMYAMRTFTDNIVIGWPVHDDGEFESGDAFLRFAGFQTEMLHHGFLVRGAISLGYAYIDDVVVFGDALIDAYKGESKLALDPRIIVCDSLRLAVQQHIGYYTGEGAPQLRVLMQDSDGIWFLNYLEEAVFSARTDRADETFLPVHKSLIERGLDDFAKEPAVWSKYAWAAKYHNVFCRQHSHLLSADHLIHSERFEASPKRLTKAMATETAIRDVDAT